MDNELILFGIRVVWMVSKQVKLSSNPIGMGHLLAISLNL
jgi:hypothetical protein